MINKIELLVHAGAASTRKDDERYRAQAEAYASFNAAVKLPLGHAAPANDCNEGPLPRDNATLATTRMRNHAEQLYLDDTQLAYTALDSQLLTSSLRQLQYDPISEQSQAREFSQSCRGEKRKRDSEPEDGVHSNPSLDVGNQTGIDANTASAIRESPVVARGSTTSSYLKSPELDRASKKTKRNVHRRRVSSEPVISNHTHRVPVTPIAALQAVQVIRPAGDITQRAGDSASGDQSTSELPTSYSLSDITSGSSKARPNLSQRSASDPGPQIGSISPTALRAVRTPRTTHLQETTLRAGSKTVHKLQQHGTGEHEVRFGALTTASTVPDNVQPAQTSIRIPAAPVPTAGPRGSTQKPESKGDRNGSATSKEDLDTLQELSVFIRAPQPPSAVDEFTTHVTEPLLFLADNIDVNKAYSPVCVSRDLRPLERGHWLLKCPEHSEAWHLQDQIAFWRFLDRTVGKGNAGWGVWCARDGEATTVDLDQTSLGTVKVFCWGEIVRHVYLLLYVASRSKVKKLGLQWIDAEGTVVVQMRKG